ncbi:MAG: hypothetical protein NVSMB1_20220 [Polyangiales bacterium]
MTHVIERLGEYALGTLSPIEVRSIEAHLSQCARCSKEAREVREAIALLGLTPSLVDPHPNTRARVLAAANGRGRLAGAAEDIAHFFEISIEKAHALLDEIDDPKARVPLRLQGVGAVGFCAGGDYRSAEAALVHFATALKWPLHRHRGKESMLVIEGALRPDNGLTYGPGSLIVHETGSEHAFEIVNNEPCICGVILYEGIEMPPGTPVDL